MRFKLSGQKPQLHPYGGASLRTYPVSQGEGGCRRNYGFERDQRILNNGATVSADTEALDCRCPHYGEGAPKGEFALDSTS